MPEETVAEIIAQRGFNSSDLYYTATRFYTTQCQATDPFTFLDTYSAELGAASSALQTLSNSLTTTKIAELEVACGANSVDGISAAVSTMKEHIDELEPQLNSVLELLKCDNLVPMFTTIVYEAACSDTVHSFYYGWVCKCIR